MGLTGSENAEIAGLGVALGLLVMGLFMAVFYRLTGRSPRRTLARFGFGRTRLRAEEGLEEIASELLDLIDKQQILGAHAEEYFNTIQGAGWKELQTVIEDLKMAHDLLQLMMAQRQYDGVCDLCDYLLDRLTPAEAWELAIQYDGLTALENWRSRSQYLLTKIVNATTLSAQETSRLREVRGGKRRRSTWLSFTHVRDQLAKS